MLLLIILIQPALASQEHIRMEDPVYLFLDRMATRGYLQSFINDTRPFTRDKVSEQLKILKELEAQLTLVDRGILDEYIADYRLELYPEEKHFQIDGDNSYLLFRSFENLKTGLKNVFQYQYNREKQHLFIYEKDDESIWIDWSEALRAESKNGSYRPLNRDEIRFFAQSGKQFSVYFDGIRYVQYNVNNYTELTDEYKGGFFQQPINETVELQGFDYSNAYIQMTGKYGNFTLGTEPLFWGNSPNSLILSDNVAPFPFFRWQKEFQKAQFTFFTDPCNPKILKEIH